MYVIRYGEPFRTSSTIDIELIDKFNSLNPEKKIKQSTSLASTFADQDFIKFLLSEIQNGYELKSDSRIEIIEYDENKGHPILVELTGEDDVNLFDFENGLLWSDEPGVPEYQSLCKGYFYLYSPDFIKSVQESRASYDKLERNIESTRYMWDEIPKEEIPKDWFTIDTPDRFEKLLAIVQKNLYGDINLETILKSSIDIEGKERIEKKAKIETKLKEHLAEIDSTREFISFGISLEDYNSSGIKHIENTPYIKPKGGLWACEYSPTPYEHSKWEQYCRFENYLTENEYLKKGIKFLLEKNSKLLRINSQEDIDYLMSKFALTINHHLTIDFEKISTLYEGVMISEKAQFIMDNYNLVNSNVISKPFCVPGIVVFSKKILKDIKDYNYELENISKNVISPTSALKNALPNITITQISEAIAAEHISEKVEHSHEKQ